MHKIIIIQLEMQNDVDYDHKTCFHEIEIEFWYMYNKLAYSHTLTGKWYDSIPQLDLP